jgi:hypothetical protein
VAAGVHRRERAGTARPAVAAGHGVGPALRRVGRGSGRTPPRPGPALRFRRPLGPGAR